MVDDTKLVLIADIHGFVSYDTYTKWLAELEKARAGFNCIFLEIGNIPEYQKVLVQPHEFAFNPDPPDPRIFKLDYGSTFQNPTPCKYRFRDDKLGGEWGFTVSSSLTRVHMSGLPGGKTQPSSWSLWDGYVKTARPSRRR
jgi:hypothetical protein